MNKRIDLYVGSDLGDFVRCNNCDTVMLLPCGADKCPGCGAVGCMSWEDEYNQEMRWADLREAGYHAGHSMTLKPERYLSNEVLDDLAIQRGDKPDVIAKNTRKVRYCAKTRTMVEMNYEGNGDWLCLHDDPDVFDDILASSDKCEKFAEIVLEEIRGDEEQLRHIGSNIIKAYQDGDCDNLLIALCGWSMDSLLEKYQKTKRHICPECRQETLRYAMIDVDGTNLEEGYSCSECGTEYIGLYNDQVIEFNPEITEDNE